MFSEVEQAEAERAEAERAGAGSLPWHAIAPVLARHPAPLQLEVHPASRPEPATLAVLMCEVLGLGAAAGLEAAAGLGAAAGLEAAAGLGAAAATGPAG